MNKTKFYAGIGSRKTPQEVLDKFYKLGKYLANKKYVLRSGGADGADFVFEKGCRDEEGKMEIYIPWENFNNNPSLLFSIPIGAYLIASQIHPAWEKLSNGAKKLHARNCLEILGQDLNCPVDFVICYTENGETKGGTATAIKIAQILKIPVFNFGSNGEEQFKEYWRN
jgi:hypothetical protein